MSAVGALRDDDAQPRLLGLEALRFVCAIAILFWHYSHFAYVGSVLAVATGAAQPAYAELRWLYDYGALAVQVFWCISGFVFAWRYAEAIQARRLGASSFLMLRASRLYPVHLVTLFAVAALQTVYRTQHGMSFVYPHNGWSEFALHLLFASNWFASASASDYSFNGPVWSVSVEVLSYGLFFVFTARWGARPRIAALICLLAGALFVSGLARSAVVLCLHYFYLGVLTAGVYQALSQRSAAARQSLIWGCGLGAALLMAASGVRVTRLLSVVTPPLLLVAVELGAHASGGWRRTIATAGGLTYSIYMTHFPLQLLTVIVFEAASVEVPWRSGWFLLAYVATAVGVGAITCTWLEQPARWWLRARWRAAMPERRRADPQAAEPAPGSVRAQ